MIKRLLLVEGKTDALIISALCKKHGIVTELIKELESDPESEDYLFAIHYKDDSNNDQVLKSIPVLANKESMEILGVVLDADAHVTGRIQAIGDQLKKVQPSLKASDVQISENGTILKNNIGNLKKMGFWIMPDNKNPGMLEDFLMKIIHKPEKCIDFATQCVEEAQKQACCTFKNSHRSKAIIHTYLAWQHEPGNTLELSIKSGKFNANAELSQKLITWLKELFSC
ncbi:MAG: DUF3226 domain-containing protein [Thiotrichaceae bacterium]